MTVNVTMPKWGLTKKGDIITKWHMSEGDNIQKGDIFKVETEKITIVAVIAETGILSVGRIEKKPAEYKGEIVLRSMIYMNLTFDHQVLDGVLAGKFLETVASYLKDPYLIMT